MTSRKATFSLLVPSYNRPEMIRETVVSLLANAAPDVEIIVSDDFSPKRDAIRAGLLDFISDGTVQYIQQPKNLGWSRNRNALIHAASGEFVVLLGDDDRLKAGAIERLRSWIARYPNVAVFGFGYDVIDEFGDAVCSFCTPRPVLYQIEKGNPWREIFSFDAVPMWSHHPFTMCSRRSIALAIPYNDRVDIADDALYLYDVLERGHQFMSIPENLFQWRNSFSDREAYRNLSGSPERCLRARGLILAELAGRSKLRAEVRSFLSDRQFLCRFCSVPPRSVNQILDVLRSSPGDGTKLADMICKEAMGVRESKGEKLRRHWRAARVMGPRHFLNVIRCYRQQRAYRASCIQGRR